MSYQRIPGKFAYSGMDVHHPPDRMPEGRCSLLFNLQPDTQSGALALRPTIASLATTTEASLVHSLARMNDSIPGATVPFSRFAGVGTKLFNGAGSALTQIDSGFSGNPLALVPYRPNQSTEPWLYTYDSVKQRRYKTDGTTQQIGIAAPSVEPTLDRTQPLYKLLGNLEDVTTGAWSGINASGGSISAPITDTRVPSGAIGLKIIYDNFPAGTGMACVAVAASTFDWMTAGASISIGTELCVIEEIFPPIGLTFVNAVQYDDNSLTGTCTIVPTAAVVGMRRNQLLLINGTVYCRVISVTAAPDGTYSFRVDTGTSTVAAGQSISSPSNFRVWTVVHHADGEAIGGNAISAVLTPSPSTGSMSAVLYGASFGVNATQIGDRPISNEDYMHLGLLFDHPEYVTEVHIMLDVDIGGAAFENNFYYYVLRQSDFAQSTLGGSNPGTIPTVQAQLAAIQYGVADSLVSSVMPSVGQPAYPTPPNPETSQPQPQILGTGQSTWVDALFTLADLTRVGTNPALGLQYIFNGIGILVYTTGGAVTMKASGMWVGGGYGPDCAFNTNGNTAPPIQWRYRYRNTASGAKSTVSPETRNGEILRRQAVALTCPASSDPQVDIVDWERRGGTNPDWHYVGSVAPGQTFIDTTTEAAAQIADPLEVTCYQPWPVTDTPKRGTAVVVGTAVGWSAGDTFNTRWLRGTSIILGGNTYSLFAPPQSATDLALEQSVPLPSSGTYDFVIPEATIEAQPIYGGWLDSQNNRICAVGDPLNPGLMYFSNVDNPDGAADSGYIEITSPSEPLLNGFYAEGSNYVFTSSSLYRVESTTGGANPYVAYRLAGVEGLAGPWAFDAKRKMLFWWGPDGIYAYGFGATAENLTADSLYPLFPHAGIQGQQGIPGVPISIAGQTIYPPNYTAASVLRVGYSESFVYATYLNTSGVVEALVYSVGAKGWRKDQYTPQATVFVLEQGVSNPKTMVGGQDGNVYQLTNGNADFGGPVGWTILPPMVDGGDSRALKQWGDVMLDYSTDTNATTPNILTFFDNLLIAGILKAIPLATARRQAIFDLIDPPQYQDLPIIHKNFTAMVTGQGPVYLFEWQPSYLPLPPDTTARPTDWQIGGSKKFKWINGVVIHADTYGQDKVFRLEYDNSQISTTITINQNGEQRLPYYFSPIYCHEIRLVPVDDVPWHDWLDEEWIGNDEPEYGGAMAVNWINGGAVQFKWLNGFKLHADTFGQPKQIRIEYDGGQLGATLTITHNGEETLPYYWQPFYGHQIRIIPLDAVPWRFWPDTEWMGNNEPEYGGELAVNWVDGGHPCYKWVNGILLHADTYNQPKRIQIQFDGGASPTTITIQHNGEETLPYYFTPVYAHQMRIVPLDVTVPWRYWADSSYLYNNEP